MELVLTTNEKSHTFLSPEEFFRFVEENLIEAGLDPVVAIGGQTISFFEDPATFLTEVLLGQPALRDEVTIVFVWVRELSFEQWQPLLERAEAPRHMEQISLICIEPERLKMFLKAWSNTPFNFMLDGVGVRSNHAYVWALMKYLINDSLSYHDILLIELRRFFEVGAQLYQYYQGGGDRAAATFAHLCLVKGFVNMVQPPSFFELGNSMTTRPPDIFGAD